MASSTRNADTYSLLQLYIPFVINVGVITVECLQQDTKEIISIFTFHYKGNTI